MPTEAQNLSPILAIDSASGVLSLALRTENRITEYCADLGSRQSAEILPQIAALLAGEKLKTADLAGILYNCGPGMFTGLRIGIALAKGLAEPFGIALTGIPALDALAYRGAARSRAPYLLAAVDARMDEVFYAVYRREDSGSLKRCTPYRVAAPQDVHLPENAAAQETAGFGNAFALYPQIAGVAGENTMARAAEFFALAQYYPAEDAAAAALLYIRDKVALTAAEQAAAKGRAL